MIYLILGLFGLIFGSFINALVFRLHMQSLADGPESLVPSPKRNIAKDYKLSAKGSQDFSILRGRSICPNCRHELAAIDLIPVLSWVMLGGKCRYCQRPISPQYPMVELATAALFVLSYLLFSNSSPYPLAPIPLILWYTILTGLIALFIYDLKWMLLPDKIIFPLVGLSFIYWLTLLTKTADNRHFITQTLLALAVSSGFFWLIFQLSKGKWIGGGDVKLGLIFGLMLANPIKSVLAMFLASILGTFLVLPQLILKKTTMNSRIPFGPLLIIGFIAAFFFGDSLINLYLKAVGI